MSPLISFFFLNIFKNSIRQFSIEFISISKQNWMKDSKNSEFIMLQIAIWKIPKKLVNLIFQLFQVLKKKIHCSRSAKINSTIRSSTEAITIVNFAWTQNKATEIKTFQRRSYFRIILSSLTKFVYKAWNGHFSPPASSRDIKESLRIVVWKVVDGIVNGRGRFLETSQPLFSRQTWFIWIFSINRHGWLKGKAAARGCGGRKIEKRSRGPPSAFGISGWETSW